MNDKTAFPDPSHHAEDRNFIEDILRFVPGFRGYLEKEYRRESDYLARTYMADRLQRSKHWLDEYMHALTSAGRIDDLPQVERVRTRLDGLISRLRSDVRGYSGVFDFVRVREAELDRVYELDSQLMREVDRLANSIDGLPARRDPPAQVAADLLTRIDALQRKFDQRGEVLKGLQPR